MAQLPGKTVYRGASDNGPSPGIWHDCPWLAALEDPSIGYGDHDDFLSFSEHITDQSTQKYDSYIDSGVTFKKATGTGGVSGVVELADNDADEDEGVLADYSPSYMVSSTAADAMQLWFEARVKRASIANNALGMFIGLAYDHGSSVTVAKTLCLTDGDMALGAFSFLGFHVDAANGDAIDFVYKAEGQTAVVVIAEVDVPVADTYGKLGFVFSPDFIASKRIKIFVDNVEQGTYVTQTNIDAATFPDAEPMGRVWCGKTGSTAESKAQMNWWRVFQIRK